LTTVCGIVTAISARKRSDTLVETLRKEYGEGFAPGYRSDAQLGTVLKREGVDSLDQLLKKR
jgi:hypothetical protein